MSFDIESAWKANFPRVAQPIQALWQPLWEYYNTNNAWTAPGMGKKAPFTQYNLRYNTHATSNLAEMHASQVLHSMGAMNITIATSLVDQVNGVDLFYISSTNQHRRVSVKLASTSMVGMSLHHKVSAALSSEDVDEWLFVDNINLRYVMVPQRDWGSTIPLSTTNRHTLLYKDIQPCRTGNIFL